jgi:hypothetical protein
MKKKKCNKKFCYDCLNKNFPIYWENRGNKKWKCPCCLNECDCNQCKKLWIKKNNLWKMNNINVNNNDINDTYEYKSNNACIEDGEIRREDSIQKNLIDKTPHLLPRPKVYYNDIRLI